MVVGLISAIDDLRNQRHPAICPGVFLCADRGDRKAGKHGPCYPLVRRMTLAPPVMRLEDGLGQHWLRKEIMTRHLGRWTSTFPASLLLMLLIFCGSASSQSRLPPLNCFWLTDTDPGTAERYGPLLLITRVSFDPLTELGRFVDELQSGPQELQVKRGILDLPAFYLETYQKDSIWNAEGQPIKPFVGKQVQHAPDLIAAHGRKYQISRAEVDDVARLLKHPEGTMPLHRRFAPVGGAERTVYALLLLLRDQERGSKQVESNQRDSVPPPK